MWCKCNARTRSLSMSEENLRILIHMHACLCLGPGQWHVGPRGTIQAVHQVGPIRSDLNKETGWLALSGLGSAPICMKS